MYYSRRNQLDNNKSEGARILTKSPDTPAVSPIAPKWINIPSSSKQGERMGFPESRGNNQPLPIDYQERYTTTRGTVSAEACAVVMMVPTQGGSLAWDNLEKILDKLRAQNARIQKGTGQEEAPAQVHEQFGRRLVSLKNSLPLPIPRGNSKLNKGRGSFALSLQQPHGTKGSQGSSHTDGKMRLREVLPLWMLVLLGITVLGGSEAQRPDFFPARGLSHLVVDQTSGTYYCLHLPVHES